MKHIMFTIYDNKAEAFLPPFTLPNHAMAARTFADCVRDPQHAFSRNPSDYNLFELGSFDDVTGEMLPIVLKNHGLGTAYLNPSLDEVQS